MAVRRALLATQVSDRAHVRDPAPQAGLTSGEVGDGVPSATATHGVAALCAVVAPVSERDLVRRALSVQLNSTSLPAAVPDLPKRLAVPTTVDRPRRQPQADYSPWVNRRLPGSPWTFADRQRVRMTLPSAPRSAPTATDSWTQELVRIDHTIRVRCHLRSYYVANV
jgi:hypothetical protein